MCRYEEIKKIFDENDGIIKTSDITSKGIHNVYLQHLIKDGKIEKIKNGFYVWVENSDISEIAIIARLFPESIVCMDSALYCYEYTDRTPDKWHIAVNRNINKESLKIQFPIIKPYYIEPKYLEVGLSARIIDGTNVRIFDKERVICDVIRYSNKLDRELVNKAIQAYIKDSNKKIPTLIEYSKKFKIFNKVDLWMGVWL